MALTTAEQVRLRIQDQPRLIEGTYYGDGSASAYLLPHRNLSSGVALVMITTPTTGLSATAASFDATFGQVIFNGVPSAGTVFRTRYVTSTFSEDEIAHWISAYGSVPNAAREAVRTLMFDGLKRARWAAPDGTSYDDTAALALLRDLYKQLGEEIDQGEAGGGGWGEWALTQGGWYG